MFCNKCGVKIPDGSAFCSGCGEKVQNKGSAQNYSGEDFTNCFERDDIEANKVISLFAYIWILFLIPLLAAPNSKYARFHANQGLILFLLSIACGIVSTPFHFLTWFSIPNFLNFLYVIPLVYMILGIINAVSGKAAELPIIGKFRIIT